MKKVIDGVSYSTATGLRLARRGPHEPAVDAPAETLFQASAGQFFVHERRIEQVWSPKTGAHVEGLRRRSCR